MKMPRIIGLTGLEGAGKDSAAEILHRHRIAFPVAFADALRQEVSRSFSVDMHELTCRATKELPSELLALWRSTDLSFVSAVLASHPETDPNEPQSPRQIMRWWGTEYRRAQDPEYWIKAMRERIAWADGIPLPAPAIVITDVRFGNEADLIREMGGQIWRMHRPGHAIESNHVSTVSGKEFAPDQTVINSGTLDELERAVLQHWSHAPLYWR